MRGVEAQPPARTGGLRLVVGSGMKPVAAGLAVGVVAALGAAPALAGMLFEAGPRDPAVLAPVVLVLGLVAAGRGGRDARCGGASTWH